MPPAVKEVTILDGQYNEPFLSYSYQIIGDENRYVALPAVSANQYYVIV